MVKQWNYRTEWVWWNSEAIEQRVWWNSEAIEQSEYGETVKHRTDGLVKEWSYRTEGMVKQWSYRTEWVWWNSEAIEQRVWWNSEAIEQRVWWNIECWNAGRDKVMQQLSGESPTRNISARGTETAHWGSLRTGILFCHVLFLNSVGRIPHWWCNAVKKRQPLSIRVHILYMKSCWGVGISWLLVMFLTFDIWCCGLKVPYSLGVGKKNWFT